MAHTKICSICACEKPIIEFDDTTRPKLDGTRSYSTFCKDCRRARGSIRWAAKALEREAAKAEKIADRIQRANRPTRTCRACGIEKSVGDFYCKGTFVTGALRYRPDCRLCEAAKIAADPDKREAIRKKTADWRDGDIDRARKCSRDSRNLHIDERRQDQRDARLDPVKGPRARQVARRSHEKHKDKRNAETKARRKANPEWYATYHQDWWKKNPENAAEYQARRRSRKAGAEGKHTAKELRALRASQNDKCANPMCAVDLKGKGSVDHRVALVNKGSNWITNLQYLCKSCNSRKRSRDNDVFLRCYAVENGLDLAA